MRYSALALLVLSLACIEAKWATPIEITSYLDPTRITKDIYTDASTGVSHIAYCNSSDGALYYAHLDESGLFLTGPSAIDTVHRCYHVNVIAPNDGKKVYLVYEARRSMSVEECNAKNLDACDDIFVLESRDGGDSWMPAVNVGGMPGDNIRRRTHKVLTSWKTKYFWTTYSQFHSAADMKYAIARFDTEKRAFDVEKVLIPKFADLATYPMALFNDKGKTTLRLVFATPLSLRLQNLYSEDNGVTWVKGASIEDMCTGEKMSMKHMLASGRFLVVGCSKQTDTYFTVSEDHGKTWTKPTKYPASDLEEVSFCLPDDPLASDRQMLVMFHNKKHLNVTYSLLPGHDLTFVDVPDAFYYAAYKVNLNCFARAKELKLRFMYHVRSPAESGSKYTLFVIDNDNMVDTPKIPMKEDL